MSLCALGTCSYEVKIFPIYVRVENFVEKHCAYRKACKGFSALNIYKYFDIEVS